MKASDWLKTIPEDAGPSREEAILNAFKAGYGMPTRWAEIDITVEPNTRAAPGHWAVLRVAEDVLAIGEDDDWVRVAVNMRTAQRLVDLCGALLPTSRISDLTWARAAVRCAPHPQPIEGMSKTTHFVAHHDAIEAERAGREGLVSTVGKDWILSPRLVNFPGWAVNYGWHDRVGKPIQGLGDAHTRPFHDLGHVDYSQWAPRLVHPTMQVDGEEHQVADVLADPELCALISDEGPCPARHPGVPRLDA